jgi:transcriptional regulator with XRE-family HTH domain
VPPRKLKTVLRTLRRERGWSMAELAEKAGVTDAYIANLETGKKSNPSLAVLKRLAKALGVPVTELLE